MESIPTAETIQTKYKEKALKTKIEGYPNNETVSNQHPVSAIAGIFLIGCLKSYWRGRLLSLFL